MQVAPGAGEQRDLVVGAQRRVEALQVGQDVVAPVLERMSPQLAGIDPRLGGDAFAQEAEVLPVPVGVVVDGVEAVAELAAWATPSSHVFSASYAGPSPHDCMTRPRAFG